MAVLASRSWTGFVVKNSHVASQEFNRKAGEGAQAALGWSSLCNRKWRDPLPPEGPERQDAQAGGVKRTMMTGLAAANAVMMSICSVPQPEYMLSRPWPGFRAGPKRQMRVQNRTAAENMSRPIQPAILGTRTVFKVESSIYCALSALARPLRFESQQH
ncbi:FixH family protein [Mesorhizobium sp. M1273]|uniref:FixH family protein n=1 Tax=Mesorhizobium sp. M1273 TaxID=2957075 RepID=UPI0033392849